MKKSHVTVCYDRLKRVPKTGIGTVEIKVYLNREERKFFKVADVATQDWPNFSQSALLKEEVAKYEAIITSMQAMGKPMTLDSLNKFLGLEEPTPKPKTTANSQQKVHYHTFIDFFHDQLDAENIQRRTRQAREVVFRSVLDFGHIRTFNDLTPANILDYHIWLQKDGKRKTTTLKHYHKRLHRYVIKAFEYGYIDRDPYKSVKIATGQYEERRPLTDEEINLLRSLNWPPKEEKARDLFIFSCFTGLCYCDAQAFDFKTMTEKKGNLYYIIGSRIKTGTNFYTPILSPAMEILEKYNYRLPRMSNQKLNDYLGLVESRANLNKKLTSHVARHTFATWVLAHDVPVEDLARMLGHKDVRTTQHYAKILPTTIQRHAENLNRRIK